MIKTSFANARPANAAWVFPVGKDGTAAANLPGVDEAVAGIVRAGAAAGRYEGEAGAIAESFIGGGQRILLVGIGGGSVDDMEKAGAGIAAKLLTSGETSVAVDLSGLTIAPSGEAVARMMAGLALRSWRYDKYRTKLPAKQKPTLAQAVIVGASEGTEATWARHSAVCEGVSLTRELVTEPANIIYPESFVER